MAYENPPIGQTVGHGPGNWDAGKLARNQEKYVSETPISFKLYTESKPNLAELVGRYFSGATITRGIGIWGGQTEPAAVIEILGTVADFQAIAFLADAIKFTNYQSCVIVTWARINRLDVNS